MIGNWCLVVFCFLFGCLLLVYCYFIVSIAFCYCLFGCSGFVLGFVHWVGYSGVFGFCVWLNGFSRDGCGFLG